MSDTPRTDKMSGMILDRELCDADFARTLERSLAAVTAERDALDKDCLALSALLQDCLALLLSIATDDDNGSFQIDHNHRKQLDTLSERIKTTT